MHDSFNSFSDLLFLTLIIILIYSLNRMRESFLVKKLEGGEGTAVPPPLARNNGLSKEMSRAVKNNTVSIKLSVLRYSRLFESASLGTK